MDGWEEGRWSLCICVDLICGVNAPTSVGVDVYVVAVAGEGAGHREDGREGRRRW